jgi:hypothetical protein
MDEHAWLAERFEEYRTRLGAVAYRMLWGRSGRRMRRCRRGGWASVAWAEARSTTSAARIPLV